MPVYEQVYRAWQGSPDSRIPAWWIIGKTGIRLLWKKSMILLLLLGSVPFFIKAAQIYMASRFGSSLDMLEGTGLLEIDAGFFMGFLKGQTFITMLVTILSGSGIIANDRKSKALPLYFSKPLGFADYLVGKFIVIAFYSCLVTFAPGMLLFLMKVFVASDMSFLRSYFWIPFSLIAYSCTLILVMGGLMMAVSSVARGARSAAVIFFVYMTFPELLRRILGKIPQAGLISIQADIQQTGSVFFGQEAPHGFSRPLSAAVLLAVVALSYLALRKRVRPTEVVS